MKGDEALHAPPDVLVDIAEGAIVEAEWAEHLAHCGTCAEELENLKKALELAGKMEVPEPGDEYWRRFDHRLKEAIGKGGQGGKRMSRWVWVAAAAIVLVGLWVSRDGHGPMFPTSEMTETVLPPAAEDPEYQLLLSVTEIVGPEEDWEQELDLVFGGGGDLDPSQLSAEEKAQLQEKLEFDLKGGNHAISQRKSPGRSGRYSPDDDRKGIASG